MPTGEEVGNGRESEVPPFPSFYLPAALGGGLALPCPFPGPWSGAKMSHRKCECGGRMVLGVMHPESVQAALSVFGG